MKCLMGTRIWAKPCHEKCVVIDYLLSYSVATSEISVKSIFPIQKNKKWNASNIRVR
jgi:hypothetical protein